VCVCVFNCQCRAVGGGPRGHAPRANGLKGRQKNILEYFKLYINKIQLIISTNLFLHHRSKLVEIHRFPKKKIEKIVRELN